jgi:hypothetical protein
MNKIDIIDKWSPMVKSYTNLKNSTTIDFISIYCELYCASDPDNPNDLGPRLLEIKRKFSYRTRKKIIGEYYNYTTESIEYGFEDGSFSSDPLRISLSDLRVIFGEFAEPILKICDLRLYRDELISYYLFDK